MQVGHTCIAPLQNLRAHPMGAFLFLYPSIAAFILSFTDSYARSLYEFFHYTTKIPFSHYHLESLPLTIIFGHSHHC